jgi:ABC-2 type transport system ATP-binding protein/ribosome-dependent ATPase
VAEQSSRSEHEPGALAKADNLTKTFGSFTAVADASLDVRTGEIVGLLGANGAGKTTLLRMLLGLLRPTSGAVALFGTPPSRRERRRLGYVPQGLGLYTDLTVAENVRFSAEAFGVDDIALPDSLQAISGRLVGEIGLGRQRQLAFACALGHRPELLVLDEPTSGVDALARARLWDTIHDQAESGVGVLVTTHYMQEAQQCDRLVIMALGRVVATGTVADIVGDAKAVEVRTDDWAGAFTALDDAGLPVTLAGRRVRVAETSPDDVRRALAGIEASIDEVPATLEETMLAISRSA